MHKTAFSMQKAAGIVKISIKRIQNILIFSKKRLAIFVTICYYIICYLINLLKSEEVQTYGKV